MKRLLYTISFLVLFAVPFQAQQSDTASRFDGFDLEQMLDDLTDLELVQDAIQAWLSVDVSGFGVVANRQLASFLEFFLRETGIQVGIRQNIDTENMFWRWIRTRNAKGTFQGGSGEHFVIFNLSFVPQEDDPRQYQITITLERQHSIETSSRVDSVRWGYFNRHIDSLNNSGQTYARDDFRMAVDGLITGGLFVLLGVNSFPLETTIRPLSFQAIDTICTRTQNDQRHVPSYEWIIVGTQRIPIKNVSLRVGDVMPLQIAVNRMEMDTVERTINLSSSRGAFRHEVSSFDSIRDLVFTATTTGEDAIIATHEMQIGERRIVETAGQLNISVFNELSNRVVIVPVHGTEPTNQRVGNLNQRELQDFLNAVFGQAVARWDVTVDEPLRVNNFNGRLRTETGVFSNYSPDMNTIISAHRNSRTVDRNTYYIFIVPQFERPEVIGFMPMRRQFGFVSFHSTDSEVLGRTIAHELGHGAFRLEHIFSAFPGVGQGRTNNLMDYTSAGGGRTPLCVSRLYRFQWEQIHDPRRGLFLFQDEEDIMARDCPCFGETRRWDIASPPRLYNRKSRLVYNAVCTHTVSGGHRTFYRLVDGNTLLVERFPRRIGPGVVDAVEVDVTHRLFIEEERDWFRVDINNFERRNTYADLSFLMTSALRTGARILPIEDMLIVVSGEDLRGEEASRIAAGGFLVLEVIQIGRVFRFIRGGRAISRTGQSINMTRRVLFTASRSISRNAAIDISAQFFINFISTAITNPHADAWDVVSKALSDVSIGSAVWSGLINYTTLNHVERSVFDCVYRFLRGFEESGDAITSLERGAVDCIILLATRYLLRHLRNTDAVKQLVREIADAGKYDIITRKLADIMGADQMIDFLQVLTDSGIRRGVVPLWAR